MAQHLESAMTQLKRRVLVLGENTEEILRLAIQAIQEKNIEIADEVKRKDKVIDLEEVEVEEECLKMLALYQPVAHDLRFIAAVHRMDIDLERIGDHAVKIAKMAFYFKDKKLPDYPPDFYEMADETRRMLKKALDSLVNLDIELAREVWRSDDVVDDFNRDLMKYFRDRMVENPEMLDTYLYMMEASRNLERIADHASNIAKDVMYMIKGEIVRHRGREFKNEPE